VVKCLLKVCSCSVSLLSCLDCLYTYRLMAIMNWVNIDFEFFYLYCLMLFSKAQKRYPIQYEHEATNRPNKNAYDEC